MHFISTGFSPVNSVPPRNLDHPGKSHGANEKASRLMTTDSNATRVVLTIAGFDPSGGAGIIADARTLLAFGCRPVAAITSLTFQSSEMFFGSIHQTAGSLWAQIEPLVKEFRIAAVKIGMLPTSDLVLEVARLVRETNIPAPVLDPVLYSSSGYELMEPAAREAWLHLKQRSEVRGQRSEQSGPQLKAIDVLDDDGTVTVLRGEWIDGPPVRGTGCMLSAAIAAGLARDMNLQESVSAAKRFVEDVFRCARDGAPDPAMPRE